MAKIGGRGKTIAGIGTLSFKTPGVVATGANTNPWGMCITPDGKNLYCGFYNAQAIGQFSIGTDGKLTALSPATVYDDYGPIYLVCTSTGSHIYVANASANNIGQFSRNSTTGLLTALATKLIACGTVPNGICIAPDDAYVYVTSKTTNTLYAYARNASTGQLSAASTPTYLVGTNPMGVLCSPDGLFLYVVNASGTIQMYSRVAATGVLTSLGTVATEVTPSVACISPDGLHFYVANDTSHTIGQYSRDMTTGLLTVLAPASTDGGNGPWYIVITPDGLSVYAAASDGQYIVQKTRDPATGLLSGKTQNYVRSDSNTAAVNQSYGPQTLAVTPNGKSLYCGNTTPVFNIGQFDIKG